jgi:hypothetical protein
VRIVDERYTRKVAQNFECKFHLRDIAGEKGSMARNFYIFDCCSLFRLSICIPLVWSRMWRRAGVGISVCWKIAVTFRIGG